MKKPCVYIVTNQPRGTLYIGVTSDLETRVYAHRLGLLEGFTKKYRLRRLVWYERHDRMDSAIRREKQLKGWKRLWKIRLIENFNPRWEDLWIEEREVSEPSQTDVAYPGNWRTPE